MGIKTSEITEKIEVELEGTQTPHLMLKVQEVRNDTTKVSKWFCVIDLSQPIWIELDWQFK